MCVGVNLVYFSEPLPLYLMWMSLLLSIENDGSVTLVPTSNATSVVQFPFDFIAKVRYITVLS